ncbi:Putative signal transduction histidine kinase [Magnetospirillum sp. XM-1]|uniref:sensor histidine kinase n=1 Tax=Magnetospirillum sp. XM-1 TaxID=1663591 RepID=UPI00073DCB40|nr:7TM-DISM domain-containing protein [Magnetospirillum sp. XM-1]CUW41485.1 Putative signal transduction histidine kinase [Magnetospirillum sp. XM-1]
MHWRWVAQVTLVLFVALGSMVFAGGRAVAGLNLSAETRVEPISGHWSALRDPSAELDIDDVTKSEAAVGFKPLPGDLAAGYDGAVWWLRTEIRRGADAPSHWLLEVEPPYLDQVGLFIEDERGVLRAFAAGDRVRFDARPLPYRTFVFPIRLDDDLPHRVYLRIKSTSSVNVTARLLSPEGFALSAAHRDLAHGLAHGATIIIILFALVQFAVGRDRLHLGFLAYAIPLELMYLAIGGFASQMIVPAFPLVADQMLGISACLAIGGGMVFASQVLDFEHHFPRMERIYTWTGRGCQWAAVSVPLGLYWLAAPVVQSLVLVSFFITAFLAMRRSLAGDGVARWYMVAFLFPIMVNMFVVARVLGLVTTPIEMDLVAHFAASTHMLLIGCGLVWYSAGIEADRRRAGQQQLEAAYQIERALEERVSLRTRELAESNATLAREIAERRAAEDRVTDRERQVRAILEAAPFPMVVSSFPDGEIISLNGPAAELLNVPADQAVGMMSVEFYAEPSERGPMIAQLHQSGAVLGHELRLRRMPRMQRWVLLSVVRFSYGGRDCVLACLNDITTRKQLEDALRLTGRRAEAALEAERQALREQRNFLAMVSHEFRVPLAIIEAASQLLNIYLGANGEAEEEVAKIRRAVRRMSELIDVCLADDRIDSSSLQVHADRLDVARMLADICDDKRPFAGERDLVLHAPGRADVMADWTLLRIAFSNLIDNALKFSPGGSPVTIEVTVEDDAVRVRIADQGPGIAVEEQSRIFEKFYRSTKSDRIRGAGLGLYIVKRIMDLHGAAISVDSERGRGTVFDIWLSAGNEIRLSGVIPKR